jgi:hypothetical protein
MPISACRLFDTAVLMSSCHRPLILCSPQYRTAWALWSSVHSTRCTWCWTWGIGFIVQHAWFWFCFGLISPYFLCFFPFGMKMFTLDALFLEICKFLWFSGISLIRISFESQREMEFWATMGMLRLQELLQMNWMHFTLWDGPEPLKSGIEC